LKIFEERIFDLTEEDVKFIKEINIRISVLKSLLKEFTAPDSNDVFQKIIADIADSQIKYDEWFNNISKKLNIQVDSTQSWNVNFDKKQIQLIG